MYIIERIVDDLPQFTAQLHLLQLRLHLRKLGAGALAAARMGFGIGLRGRKQRC